MADPFDGLLLGSLGAHEQQHKQVPTGMTPLSTLGTGYSLQTSRVTWPVSRDPRQQLSMSLNPVSYSQQGKLELNATTPKVPQQMMDLIPPDPRLQPGNQPPITFTQSGSMAGAQGYALGQSLAASRMVGMPMRRGSSDSPPSSLTHEISDAVIPRRQNQDQASSRPASVSHTPSPSQVPTPTGSLPVMMTEKIAKGAMWVPPAEQLPLYQSMFASASAGSAVPGTVSGRAAVQFFSRSGLPKDILKTIWSLCDPELTGCIREPGFFAAMRLIAMVQASTFPGASVVPAHVPPQLPSLAALDGMRYTLLPPPRLEGFTSTMTVPAGEATLPSSCPVTSTSTSEILDTPEKSMPKSEEGAGRNERPGADPFAALNGAPSLGNGGSTPPTTAPTLPTTDPPANLDAGKGDTFHAVKDEHVDEEDFGDFTPANHAPPLAPATTETGEEGGGDGGDDFGDFTGADDADADDSGAVKWETLETMDTPLTSQAHPRSTEQRENESSRDWTATQAGRMDSHGGAAPGEGTGGGLEDLIKSNLKAATSGPQHLASMTTPSLLGKPPAPAMVNRASDSRDKLSVFDAMADLDLAAHQEEWNDFADETTAPATAPAPAPASPFPPPAVSINPTEKVEHAHDASSPAGDTSEKTPDTEGDRTDNAAEGGKEVDDSLFGEMKFHGAGGSEDLPGFETSTTTSKPGEGTSMGALGDDPAAGDKENDEDWGEFEEAGGVDVGAHDAATAVPIVEVHAGDAGDSGEEVSREFMEETSKDSIGLEVSTDGGVGDEGLTSSATESRPQGPEEVDPFAGLSSPGTSASALVDLSSRCDGIDPVGLAHDGQAIFPGDIEERSRGTEEEVEEKGQDDVKQSSGASATHAETAVDLPLSLRGLRDGLAARGRLEEAIEVQRRMELPVVEWSSRQKLEGRNNPGRTAGGVGGQEDLGTMKSVDTGAASRGAAKEGDGEGSEERDLERWRNLLKLPPAPTLDKMVEDTAWNAVDASVSERFRDRFIKGRPPVEEEAVAGGGGGKALESALQRQRAARRALLLFSIFRKTRKEKGEISDAMGAAIDDGVTADDDLLLDMGGTGGGRSPPTLSDWEIMVSSVTRMVQAGLDTLRPGDECTGLPPPRATESSETTVEVIPAEGSTVGDLGERATGDASDDSIPRAPRTKATKDVVAREVANCSKFSTFSRGLREAVRVCRLFEAAALDGLETLDGYEKLEKTWEAFQKRLDEVGPGIQAGDRPATQLELTVGLSSNPVDRAPDVNGGNVDVELPSVESIREASLEAPPDSLFCAVCLQPLDIFGSPSFSGVVEYCGVRYLARAVNLWVNVLDKAPPRLGQLVSK